VGRVVDQALVRGGLILRGGAVGGRGPASRPQAAGPRGYPLSRVGFWETESKGRGKTALRGPY
jgi:hypothetical protein